MESSSKRTARSPTAGGWGTRWSNRLRERAGRSPAQVLLRWAIQHDMVVLPKSTREARVKENAALFDFTLDAAAMKALDDCDEGLATGWDPRTQP